MDDLLERSESTARIFRSFCEENGHSISADGRVKEEVAALLVGYAQGTLRNMRSIGGGPPAYAVGAGGGRYSYRISELAEWVEGRRKSPLFLD